MATANAGQRRILVMGVSGAGKSTVGEALARHYQLPFIEADTFHSAANRAKMAAGTALTDADRRPWLTAIHARLVNEPGGWVLACSALREAYRRVLFEGIGGVEVVWLTGSAALLSARLARRRGHFMSPTLLESQIHALEPPEKAIKVDAAASIEDTVANVLRELEGGK